MLIISWSSLRWGENYDPARVCVCVCVTTHTWGRAWTTVSSSALIPVAIFNSFNTGEKSQDECSIHTHRLCMLVCTFSVHYVGCENLCDYTPQYLKSDRQWNERETTPERQRLEVARDNKRSIEGKGSTFSIRDSQFPHVQFLKECGVEGGC